MSEENKPAPFAPYLTVKGARNAIEWYEKILGAKTLSTMVAEDGERLMHATLSFNGHALMLSDEFPEFSDFRGPLSDPVSPVAISLRLESPDAVDAMYKSALAAGATSSWAPEDMFWGDRFCQIIDPFHHRWMLAAAK